MKRSVEIHSIKKKNHMTWFGKDRTKGSDSLNRSCTFCLYGMVLSAKCLGFVKFLPQKFLVQKRTDQSTWILGDLHLIDGSLKFIRNSVTKRRENRCQEGKHNSCLVKTTIINVILNNTCKDLTNIWHYIHNTDHVTRVHDLLKFQKGHRDWANNLGQRILTPDITGKEIEGKLHVFQAQSFSSLMLLIINVIHEMYTIRKESK